MEITQQINKILEEYFDYVDKELPNVIESFYVYGSLVLSDFHPRKSDIDFVAILGKKLKIDEINKLQQINTRIEEKNKNQI